LKKHYNALKTKENIVGYESWNGECNSWLQQPISASHTTHN